MRAAWSSPQFFPASRFLDEIPEALLHVARAGSSAGFNAFSGGEWSGSGGFGGRSQRGPSLSGGFGGGRTDVNRPSFGTGRKPKGADQIPSLDVGDRVTHDSFGMGTVTSVSGQGDKTQVEVAFREPHGTKRLLLRYAPVTKL